MDEVDTFSTLRWRRWNRRIYSTVARTEAIGLWTRRASPWCSHRFHDLLCELVAYRGLCRASLPGYDRRRKKRMLVRERQGIQAKVRRLHALGHRVWWAMRRDGTGVDILIAAETWSPVSADDRRRGRR
jgi:hypothetical protein